MEESKKESDFEYSDEEDNTGQEEFKEGSECISAKEKMRTAPPIPGKDEAAIADKIGKLALEKEFSKSDIK